MDNRDMHIYQLSEILGVVSCTFRELFGEFTFLFESEISRINCVGKRYYLDLIEMSSDGKILAKSRGIIWDSDTVEIFLKDVGVKSLNELKGHKFLFTGKVSFHQEYGFSVGIYEISSEYTLGVLKKSQKLIRDKLVKLGVHEKNKRLKDGYPPFNIAVISSASSQGLNDFESILSNSDYLFETTIFEAKIHGNDAKESVVNALRKIYKDISENKILYDFVAIVRGGGGSDGILWQDDFDIAKGVCYMPIPVFLAIGHTSDKYILDKLVKYSAKTPSDAAYQLINLVHNYMQQAHEWNLQIGNIVKEKIINYAIQLDNKYSNIEDIISKQIQKIKNNIETYYKVIKGFSPHNLIKKGYAILKNPKGDILTKKQIDKLKKGDTIVIVIFDKEIKCVLK